jgi:O-antigen ligase
VGWALLAPWLAGHRPSSAAIARILDWVTIPFAARALALLPVPRRVQVALTCGAVLCLSCAAALLQHLGAWPPEETFAPLAWTRIPFQRVYEVVSSDPLRYAAGGLLFHRLKFANVTGMATLWALALALGSGGKLRRMGLGVAAVGLASVVMLPHARAASVALVLVVAVVLLVALPDRRKALALCGAVGLVAALTVLATPSLRQRFRVSLTDSGSGDRRHFVEAGLRAVREHPIVGVGLGRFRPGLYATADTPPGVVEHPGKAHNQLLSLAADAGLPAAVLLCGWLFWLWRRMPWSSPAGTAGRACLLFIGLLSALHDPLFHAEVSMALTLALGAGLATAPPREPTAPG